MKTPRPFALASLTIANPTFCENRVMFDASDPPAPHATPPTPPLALPPNGDEGLDDALAQYCQATQKECELETALAGLWQQVAAQLDSPPTAITPPTDLWQVAGEWVDGEGDLSALASQLAQHPPLADTVAHLLSLRQAVASSFEAALNTAPSLSDEAITQLVATASARQAETSLAWHQASAAFDADTPEALAPLAAWPQAQQAWQQCQNLHHLLQGYQHRQQQAAPAVWRDNEAAPPALAEALASVGQAHISVAKLPSPWVRVGRIAAAVALVVVASGWMLAPLRESNPLGESLLAALRPTPHTSLSPTASVPRGASLMAPEAKVQAVAQHSPSSEEFLWSSQAHLYPEGDIDLMLDL
jgi:hypothetical protein